MLDIFFITIRQSNTKTPTVSDQNNFENLFYVLINKTFEIKKSLINPQFLFIKLFIIIWVLYVIKKIISSISSQCLYKISSNHTSRLETHLFAISGFMPVAKGTLVGVCVAKVYTGSN
jgi:hypothetical protein